MPGTRGFVFAATGAGYADLAAQAARSLRAAMPDVAVDLYTDQPDAGAPFDKVHRLSAVTVRPKFEALAESRFDRTIYLDADILVLAPIGDVFDILGRFQIAMAHDQGRNNDHNQQIWRTPLPPAFPQLNSGVIASDGSDAARALFAEIDRVFRDEGRESDQAVLRELVYFSDLRLAVLPPEYNLMYARSLEVQNQKSAAPRILHHRRLHYHLHGPHARLTDPEELLGPDLWAHAQALIAADRTLGQTGKIDVPRLADSGLLGRLRRELADWRTRRLRRRAETR